MMSQKQAIQQLIQAVHIGQKRGAWTLEEAFALYKAIECFIQKPAPKKVAPKKVTKKTTPVLSTVREEEEKD